MLRGRSELDIELYVEEVRRRGHQLEIGNKDYKLSDLVTRKNEITKKLKNIE